MKELNHLFTDPVLHLINEADELKPNSTIPFEVMRDPQMIRDSAGAAVQSDDNGQETVYLDPKRATEYMVAHELMHIILHRSHWPQMYSISPPEDRLASNIANNVDNILDHYIFNPDLDSSGFKLAQYRSWYVRQIAKWPKQEPSDPEVLLRRALFVLNALLYKSVYRRKVIRTLKLNHPKILELALNLETLVDPQGGRDKPSIRQS